MSGHVEVVAPAAKVRSVLGRLPPAARVVKKPSTRQNIDRVVLLSLNFDVSMDRLLADLRDLASTSYVVLSPTTWDLEWTNHDAQVLALFSCKTPTEPFLATSGEEARRIVHAYLANAQRELIASATLEGDELHVWSCEPRLFRLPIRTLPELARLSKDDLSDFEVSSSGSRVHWERADLDLDLDTIRFHVDPKARHESEQRYRQEAQRYATAIRILREAKGLKQSDIEGLSDRQVRRIEDGERLPRIATLEKLAKAHSLSIPDYLAELAKRS